MKMMRIQILLDSHRRNRARQRATEFGVSLAEYIGRLVGEDLERPAPAVDLSVVFNLGNAGGSDVAMAKDAMDLRGFRLPTSAVMIRWGLQRAASPGSDSWA